MGELIMYNLSKSSKKVSDLSVGDSVVVYTKGLPYQTKMCIGQQPRPKGRGLQKPS